LQKYINQKNFKEIPQRDSEFQRIIKVFFRRKLALIGFVIIVVAVLVAIFAPLLSPYDPYKIDPRNTLSQPSREHLLGTDTVGRDTLSRVIYGSRTSLLVGITAVGAAFIIGQSLGLIAAFFGGITYSIIMRLIDALMSIPFILTAVVIAAILGGGLQNIIIALGVSMIPVQCRVMCGQALSVKQNDYVLVGRAMGASDLRMMLSHIVPNAFPPLIVLVTLEMGNCILSEAGLSFLGLGIAPPGAAWGNMVNEGYPYLMTNPLLSIAPGFAIMLFVFGFNMVGDGLRDALDPRLRGAF
jgi:peptide/nickel transport system permease protein